MNLETATATQVVTGRNLVAGEWDNNGENFNSVSPSTGKVLGTFVSASEDAAQTAIDAARRIFDTTDWSRDARRRSRALTELADNLEARIEEDALPRERQAHRGD